MPHFLIICLNKPSQLTSDKTKEYRATFISNALKSTNGTANAIPASKVINRFKKRDTFFCLFFSSANLINKNVNTFTDNIKAKSITTIPYNQITIPQIRCRIKHIHEVK